MIMAAINKAVEELIEQVPAADGFETKLIKEKVDLLRDLTPKVIAPTFDPDKPDWVVEPGKIQVVN